MTLPKMLQLKCCYWQNEHRWFYVAKLKHPLQPMCLKTSLPVPILDPRECSFWHRDSVSYPEVKGSWLRTLCWYNTYGKSITLAQSNGFRSIYMACRPWVNDDDETNKEQNIVINCINSLLHPGTLELIRVSSWFHRIQHTTSHFHKFIIATNGWKNCHAQENFTTYYHLW